MGYNTRRKSLSLPSLGIAIPGAPRSARSPPAIADMQQPAKKQKRSHSGSSTSSLTSPSNTLPLRAFDEQRPKSAGRVADTPPPSPGGESGQAKVDTQGIDDEIVVGVIQQLEKTGNRPHLLKELALVLSPTIPIVESSANPAAIISSRLATYLKRTWTALSRCPLDKKLVGTHPKRVYYFLTTTPHQPIPADAANGAIMPRIVTPSLSSGASEEEDMDARARARMSPSPELDLSDYDESSSADPFSSQVHPPTNANIEHNRRAQSPPLEKEEREFTLTATSLQKERRRLEAERERSASLSAQPTQISDVNMDDVAQSIEETEELAARKNSEAAAALFGHMASSSFDFSIDSPALKSQTFHIEMPPPAFKSHEVKLEIADIDWSWSDMRSPENIELDELEEMFGGY
ncbi:mucin [Stagonosporopsis vannaccii]|nr:mucin [Stagonosporopsis vannaccii]